MHGPSAAREVLRRLRAGAPTEELVAAARAIRDPDHGARTLLRVAADPRVPAARVPDLVDDVCRRLDAVTRPSAQAELVAELLPIAQRLRADEVDRGGRSADARKRLVDSLVRAAVALPDGPWLDGALQAVAPSGDPGVLDRAVQGGAAGACRAFVRLHGGLERIDDARLRALCGDFAAVWLSGDPEVARVVAWAPETDPEAFAASAAGEDAAAQVLAFTLAGARLDRDGKDGIQYLERATSLLAQVDDARRPALARKLDAARRKAGLEGVPVPKEPATVKGAASIAVAARPGRDVLGLVDGYQGTLKAAHLRAAARAAPLCVAFDLDLGLYGFPIRDGSAFIAAAEAETSIGEGVPYLRRLWDEKRIHTEDAFPGVVVAATPHPDARKRGDLPVGRVVLLMGVGRQGLPRRYLDGAQVHYEITGRGVSLETATAMGILAERLRQHKR